MGSHTAHRRAALATASLLAGSVLAHDTFLVLDSHRLEPHSTAE
jgi:hypothetical protein